ncbi:hypothetical protein [Streptomyces monashensis]|uniref:hypothetical protein n=1 Tax=Streptomyces monashensis TaxID=1678012 RepID=UPI0015A511DA|nr:hypothetical protein [Streptomyces monashensis]
MALARFREQSRRARLPPGDVMARTAGGAVVAAPHRCFGRATAELRFRRAGVEAGVP